MESGYGWRMGIDKEVVVVSLAFQVDCGNYWRAKTIDYRRMRRTKQIVGIFSRQ